MSHPCDHLSCRSPAARRRGLRAPTRQSGGATVQPAAPVSGTRRTQHGSRACCWLINRLGKEAGRGHGPDAGRKHPSPGSAGPFGESGGGEEGWSPPPRFAPRYRVLTQRGDFLGAGLHSPCKTIPLGRATAQRSGEGGGQSLLRSSLRGGGGAGRAGNRCRLSPAASSSSGRFLLSPASSSSPPPRPVRTGTLQDPCHAGLAGSARRVAKGGCACPFGRRGGRADRRGGRPPGPGESGPWARAPCTCVSHASFHARRHARRL